MDIKQLQYFVRVCETNSFSEAARKSFISAQGVNIAITRLETELGTKLLERTSHGIYPTRDGEYLLPKARMILQTLDECHNYFEKASNSADSVSLMVVRGTVELLARPAIYEFKKKYPDIDINLKVSNDLNCINAINTDNTDIAICVGPISAPNIKAKHLTSSKCVLVVNKKHPYAEKEFITIEDLKSIPLAIPERTSNITNTLLALCQSQGFVPDYSFVDEPRMASYLADMNMRSGISSMISAEKLTTPNIVNIPFTDKKMDWDIFLLSKESSAKNKYKDELINIIVSINRKRQSSGK